jgi:small subunit ribosomal protein S2
MAETPAPPEAAAANPSAPPTEATEATPTETFEVVEREALSIRELLEAGVHFGHQTRRWNPRMKRFLFGERNGVHIIDLDQSLPRFVHAMEFLRETVAAGGKVLFVSTKRQAQSFVEAESQRASQYFVSRRWLGGMLTNFKTVRKSIEHFKELLELVGDEEKSNELSKKELSRINRQIEKYTKSLDGIKEMTRLPDALFIIDVKREAIAVKEANRLGIPIVAVVDSNCDPNAIDYIVPGNDDSTRAIELYCQRAADACAEGALLHNERIQSEVSDVDAGAAAAGERTGTGRVVVEIQQEPRRGRGTHSAEPREPRSPRKGEKNAPATDAAREGSAVAAADAPTVEAPATGAPAGETAPTEPAKGE